LYKRKSTFLVTVTLLVLLRIAIGWQFLYEGLWKLQSRQTARPWTSAGYLRNSQGPFRSLFLALSGDPNELNWLNAEWVGPRWDTWHAKFVAVHRLDKNQTTRLDRLINGPKDFRAELAALPEGLEFRGTLAKRLTFIAKSKRLIVDGTVHLTPRERDAALKLVTVEENPSEDRREANEVARRYQQAVRIVFARNARLSFKERMRASLLGDPERAGLEIKDRQTKQKLETRLGQIELYGRQLKRYETSLAQAATDFQQQHARLSGLPGHGSTAEIRASLVGPIKALERDLVDAAEKLLTPQQRARGPVPMPATRIQQIDTLTMWALAVIGVLLIAGLCSRMAAVAGAALLFSFYLVMPPWPGVPTAPGPEHSLWVNKNLIEMIALLALASVPSGRWFGLDALAGRMPLKWRKSEEDELTLETETQTQLPDEATATAVESDPQETDTGDGPEAGVAEESEPDNGTESEAE
jgi:uncharacterized membrane protein YphA (DoxX/SURF4 family)